MGRPVIGITAYVERASWGRWVDVPGALVPHRYVRQVEDAGGIAVVIPPRPDADDGTALAIVERLDGVILAGGVDVAPELYADERHASVQASRPDRDSTEPRHRAGDGGSRPAGPRHLQGDAGHGGRRRWPARAARARPRRPRRALAGPRDVRQPRRAHRRRDPARRDPRRGGRRAEPTTTSPS